MPKSDDIVLLGGLRTPFARYGGALTGWSSVDIAAFLLPRVLRHVGVLPSEIDLLVCGTAFQAEVANHTNITARQIVLASGLPESTTSFTVDQASCSGMMAVLLARQAIASGEAQVAVAVGTEAMGEAPFLLPSDLRWGRTRGDFSVRDPLFPMRFPSRPGSLIEEVDHEANSFGITRQDMDKWALESQYRYESARSRGYFAGELIDVPLKSGSIFAHDEPPRPSTSIELLQDLRTVHGSKFITAGNSPGMESGAAAVVFTKRSHAEKLGVVPLATLASGVSVAGNVSLPLSQTGRAVQSLLTRRGIHLEDVTLFELEEAFAAVVPITARYLEKECGGDYEHLLSRCNQNGGAVACGHPIGASGVRIVLTLARQLSESTNSLGVAAMAGGLSQGDAVLLYGADGQDS